MDNNQRMFAAKIALITGGTRGIGLAIARRLLDGGARVILCGSRSASVAAALDHLNAGAAAEGLVADVSRLTDVTEMASAVQQRHAKLDILVNSAGIGLFAPVAELTPEQWDRVIGVNLTGAYYCCHHLLPILRAGGGGDVINISSLAGSNAFAGGAAYNASKFGLNGFSEAMMQDYRNDGIRVSYVAPGSVDTEFSGRAPVGAASEYGGRIAPEDVAEVVATILAMPRRTSVSRVEIRPSRPPRK